ncbi:hypothetical protein HY948_01260 [Candidatus Gottesmanbacteria bacterium]|nr:hypothetical protein [Candidatus Gottesmanbacteria bacterium]
MFILFTLLLLNLVISFWNASVVGRYWTEKSRLPGLAQFLMWCGAIMSVAGFFSVYVTVLTMIMKDLNLFAPLALALFKVEFSAAEIDMLVQNIFDLAYLIIIFPVLGTGLAITVNSWIVAYVRRDWTSVGVGIYNAGAQLHNMVNAVRHVPRAAKSLSSGLNIRFKAKDGKALASLFLLLLPVVVSLGAAIATTALIMRASDEKYELEDMVQG